MSLWRYAIAGGLQGLGRSISLREEEQREARGMALRERFLLARQRGQQEFVAGEAALTRDARSDEAQLTREHQTELAEQRIDAVAAEGVATREHQAELTGQRITAAAAEGAATRGHRETLQDESLTAMRQRHTATLTAADARLTRELTWREGENAKDRQARITPALQRLTRQLAAAQQALDDRDFNLKLRTAYDDVYQRVDETGERATDPDLVTRAMSVFREEGKHPWEISLTGPDIFESVREEGLSVDDAVENLRLLQFQLPNAAIRRARSMQKIYPER